MQNNKIIYKVLKTENIEDNELTNHWASNRNFVNCLSIVPWNEKV